MGRPLRLLFYLGLPLSIQAAFPMHKPHNTIHYSMSHTVSCWTLYSLLQIKLDPTYCWCITQYQPWDVLHSIFTRYKPWFFFTTLLYKPWPQDILVCHTISKISCTMHREQWADLSIFFSGSFWRLPMHTHPDYTRFKEQFWNCDKKIVSLIKGFDSRVH